jgi:hypothetical protein
LSSRVVAPVAVALVAVAVQADLEPAQGFPLRLERPTRLLLEVALLLLMD